MICTLTWVLGTAQNYQSAESVEYDEVNDRWLVANGSNIIADDGQGNLSFFGSGTASHGMEIMGNTLFAIGSNIIRGYDLDSGDQVMSLSISGVSFLNGMASDGVDQLFVTDFSQGRIHQVDVSDLSNPTSTEIVANAGPSPNGILYDGANDRLLFVSFTTNAKIRQVDLSDNSVTDIVSNTGLTNIDGIVYSAVQDQYFVSSWSPAQITRYNSDFSTSSVVDSPTLNSPADIGIDDTNGVVGIPMGNDVIFLSVTESMSVETFSLESIQFSISENPVNASSQISFYLQQPTAVVINIYSLDGKRVGELFAQESASGLHQCTFGDFQRASGMYVLQMSVDNQLLSKKIMVK